MIQYKLLTKGMFEKRKTFEERLNSMALEGWRAVSMASESSLVSVLMEKSR
ncbi:MAG: hypothetical protein ACI91R_002211 [Vicingaceae bacterium]|jgi:hypothetical protein